LILGVSQSEAIRRGAAGNGVHRKISEQNPQRIGSGALSLAIPDAVCCIELRLLALVE
jgi:hypothetical protein